MNSKDYARSHALKNGPLKKRSPAFAGLQEIAGVFGVGASMPQFLAELTSALNSLICDQFSMPPIRIQAKSS